MNSPEHAQKHALSHAFCSVILSLPWVIAYFSLYGNLNQNGATDCAVGTVPLAFGNFARWAYLASIITLAVMIPFDIYIARRKASGDDHPPISPCIHLLKLANACLAFAIWIYAIVALSHRNLCENTQSANQFISLLWATVLFPAIFVGVACCCCCFCVLVGGGAMLGMKNRA